MRFFKYKCPVNSQGCRFEWGKTGCMDCGITYNDEKTIWDDIQELYWTIIPHYWRPTNIWYRFKCWGWQRYTTIKPRTLGHGYCDTTALMPHVIFELLCQFVEEELRNGQVDWDVDPERAHARDRMEALYKWWNEEYDEDYPWSLDDNKFNPVEAFKEDMKNQDLLIKNCQEVIALSPYMWT